MSDDAALAAGHELADDEVPERAPARNLKPAVPSSDSVREVRSAEELAQQYGSNGENGAGAQLLALAFAFHPFTALFERLAVARYPRKQSKRACVDAHVANHPWLYRTCVILDMVAVGVVVLLFLAILAFGAYKTLFGKF